MLGIGKSSSWYLIQALVATESFASEGYRFYYVDERTPKGKAMHHISGPGHAEFFLHLAESQRQEEPLATFVRGKGHVRFDTNEGAVLRRSTIENELDPGYGRPGSAEGNYGK